MIREILGLGDDESAPADDRKPCSDTGHNFEKTGIHGCYSRGVPFFGPGRTFTVKRKDRYECTKCGKTDFRKTRIGEIRVTDDGQGLEVV